MGWPDTKRELKPARGEYGFHDRIRPRRTFQKEMFYSGRFPEMFDLVYYENSRVMQLFLAIHELELLNKLADDGIVDGEQLIFHMYPDYNGIASYKLTDWRSELEQLDILGIIRHWKLRTPTHGYGYDEGYYLTDELLDLIKDRPMSRVKKIVGGIIASNQPIKPIDED